MIDIDINGKTLTVKPGSTIIEAADEAGIYIPRFCYHKKLSVAANCRMCLVEVEKSNKPLPACATPVSAGMKVFTQSKTTQEAQRSVMEFLLINHPLDCPICDQGGECELQDLSLEYGRAISRFTEGKRSVQEDHWGSLIATEMTRCIQCTRCVRFSQEIAGIQEIGAINRGENMQISTCIQSSMTSELSGNIIDICPVGALTSRPFRFTARAWELQQTASIAPHDCVGSNIYIHTRRGSIMRVVPRENEGVNEVWLSDRDRFSYTALAGQDRLLTPLVRQGDQWREVDWDTALTTVAVALRKTLIEHGPTAVAALASPSSTLEEFYLLQKLLRSLDCQSIDHRLHQTDYSDQDASPLYPELGVRLDQLPFQKSILLVGSNLHHEQPIIGHRVRQAALKGTQIGSVNCVDYDYHFNHQKIIVAPQQMVFVLAGILAALLDKTDKSPHKQLATVKPTTPEKNLAKHLKEAGSDAVILLGAVAHNHPQFSLLRTLANCIANESGAKIGYLTEGANSAGAWLAGAVPHRAAGGQTLAASGLSAAAAIKAKLKAYLLLHVEPGLDCANANLATEALKQADFVLALSAFKPDASLEKAHVILPVVPFTETAGTFVNVEGRWQSFLAVAQPREQAKPAWKVFCMLADLLSVPKFSYTSPEEARDELRGLINETPCTISAADFQLPADFFKQLSSVERADFTRITEWPIYRIDSLVRRSLPLQASATQDAVGIHMNATLANHLQLKENQHVTVKQQHAEAQLTVLINDRIPDHCVWIPAAHEKTAKLGEPFGAVEIIV